MLCFPRRGAFSRTWKSTMRKNGVVEIIDRTPDLPGRLRGEEIEAWLAAHPEVEVYAILDDDTDMLPHQPHFRTCFSKGGLTERIARQVQHYLHGNGKGYWLTRLLDAADVAIPQYLCSVNSRGSKQSSASSMQFGVRRQLQGRPGWWPKRRDRPTDRAQDAAGEGRARFWLGLRPTLKSNGGWHPRSIRS